MCDYYNHHCEVCGIGIPVHIGDYNYDREDVEAWCRAHIPDNDLGIEIYTVPGADGQPGQRFGLRLKHGRLIPSHEDVCINLNGAEPNTTALLINTLDDWWEQRDSPRDLWALNAISTLILCADKRNRGVVYEDGIKVPYRAKI